MTPMPSSLCLSGRILFLTADAGLIERQLAGEDFAAPPGPLLDNISTDEITPAWTCFWYDRTLGRHALVGLRHGAIGEDSVKRGGFRVLVAGRAKGCGSSRETAPYAEQAAGIELVIAESFEKIYRQNCQNIGLYTSTDFGLIERLRRGEPIPVAELTRELDAVSRSIVERGGLFAFNRARLAGEAPTPAPRTTKRPLTLVEKIIARHTITDAAAGGMGVPAVAPGDAVFCRADVRFSHDYVTAMAASLFGDHFGAGTPLAEPGSVYAFRDHLTLLNDVMPEEQRQQGLLALAEKLGAVQGAFCDAKGISLYGDDPSGGAKAICHSAMVDDIALPGQLVIGTDSHTCTAGALGCFAFGVGATDMANAWLTCDVRLTVPGTVRIELAGRLAPGVAAKDAMLHLLAHPYVREGRSIGQVLEFGGSGLATLGMDERATLTNMAVEAGATSGLCELDDVTWAHLAARRHGRDAELPREKLCSDPGAAYAATLPLDLAAIEPMVALPADPRNGMPMTALERQAITIAYGGSCTGGKRADLDMYAAVLEEALRRGQRVHSGVRLFIQCGSQAVRRYAAERGYLELFARAGAELVAPSCGACINAGLGVSTSRDDVTVAATNRNFPGRSGPGRVFLASPYVVAASAIAGHLTTPAALFGPAPLGSSAANRGGAPCFPM
jgi:3-isopropylmalate/(R)-2-methylmalate dehydratase large subunit